MHWLLNGHASCHMHSWVQVWQVLGFASLGVLGLFSLRLLAGESTVKRPPEMDAKSMKIDENRHLMVEKPTLRGPGGPFGARGCPRGEALPNRPQKYTKNPTLWEVILEPFRHLVAQSWQTCEKSRCPESDLGSVSKKGRIWVAKSRLLGGGRHG